MGSKYARIAGITAGRPAVTINRPLVGAEGKSISHKNHLMEEFELWHFLQGEYPKVCVNLQTDVR